ncbi:MAG: alpha/beta hydrolase [bacterium]|nr:alpha/beta hydrolase [bacterium]
MNYINSGKDSSGNDVKLYYTDYGKGKPVILIHGWPLNSDMWEYQMNDLVQSGFRVIAYDRRGFGRSSRPWDGYDYDTLTDDLKAIIDQLKLDDITLVGFSMGGGEIVRYFSRHGGNKVTKAILISAVTPYMLNTEDNPDGVPQEMFDEMALSMQNDRINFLEDFGKSFFGIGLMSDPLSDSLLEYFKQMGSIASPWATLECAKAFSTTDFRQEMSSLNVPVLLIHGDADKTVPIDATSKQSEKLIPDNTLVIYEGASHGLFYTDKESLNAHIINFIKEGKA